MFIYLFVLIYFFILPWHEQHYERVMTIVARRPKGNYKAYVRSASSILTLQMEKEIGSRATGSWFYKNTVK